MSKLRVLDLFSGIGGFSLGLECTGGFETVAFCEIEDFPQKVLKKHWPDVPIYEDIRNVTKEKLDADGIRCDVVTGGFPCQDISVAGKQAGIRDGERSSLFDEIIRLTRDIRPQYVICENVSALLSGSDGEWFSYILTEFSRIGYVCEWESISAEAVGAWHKRDRVWLICYPEISDSINSTDRANKGKSREKESIQSECWTQRYTRLSSGAGSKISNAMQQRLQRRKNAGRFDGSWKNINKLIAGCSKSIGVWSVESSVGRVANGIPRRMDRIKGLGNAVVPQIPELIGRAILEVENDTKKLTTA